MCDLDAMARTIGNREGESMKHTYSPWRHGGWYVHTVNYPSGAIGCVSNRYPDKKWRIVCDNRRTELGAPDDFTFRTRDAAADAEATLIASGQLSAFERKYLTKTA